MDILSSKIKKTSRGNGLKRSTSLLLALVMLIGALSGCMSDPNKVAPLMWRVTSADGASTVILFGSIHGAEESLYPLDATITEAFESSDYLAVECDIQAMQENPLALAPLAGSMMYLDGRTVADDVGPELHSRAKEILEQADLGMPLGALDMLRPFTWVSLMTNIAMDKAGISAEYGLDMHFLTAAKEQEIEILEIESMEAQIEMFIGFSPEVQRYLFESALEVETGAVELQNLYAQWKQGNQKNLTKILQSDTADVDADTQQMLVEYNKAMFTDRNKLMTDTAKTYLEDGKNVFYVVGLFHMIGDDGIVAQLKDQGYKVKQIKY